MRNFIIMLACLGLALPGLAAAQNFDPFRPGTSHSPSKAKDDYNPSIRDNRPTDPKSSSLTNLKLSDYDQDLFDNCRAEARKSGTDIMQLNTSAGFLKAPYRNASCAKFVVEKMLNGMDNAMRTDPEALIEFQRNADIQHKYDELKKAYTILNRGNPIADTGSRNNFSNLKINNDYYSKNTNYSINPSTQLLSQPDNFPSEQNALMVEPKQVVPQDWWAKDYYKADMAKVQAQIANRQDHRQRMLAPEGLTPSPLKSIMMQAEQKEQDRVSSRHGGRNTLPSFQNQDPYQ